MSRGVGIAEIKQHAIDRLEDILERLVPGGQRSGNLYLARNPTRQDRRAGSFVVWLRGPARGGFKEFASDEKGDVLHLVAYCLNGGVGFRDRRAVSQACDWVADLVGLHRMPDTARAAALEGARRRKAADEREAGLAEKKHARAFDMWGHARPLLFTLGETYLTEARGIDLRVIPTLENDLRFIASQEWWMGAQRDPATGRKVAPGPHYPCIICAMRDVRGQVRAVHLTFIERDGSGKAKVPGNPKLIWPGYAGCVIRIARGEGNLTPEEAIDADVAGPCGITEGLEDGLSLAYAAPELRVWAAAALSNIANVPAHPCVDAWLLARQNDTARKAIETFDRAKAALEATGRPVAEIPAYGGKDLNDTLRGG